MIHAHILNRDGRGMSSPIGRISASWSARLVSSIADTVEGPELVDTVSSRMREAASIGWSRRPEVCILTPWPAEIYPKDPSESFRSNDWCNFEVVFRTRVDTALGEAKACKTIANQAEPEFSA